jgi:DHA1 family multidrug resistance protein-like MFS transporter
MKRVLVSTIVASRLFMMIVGYVRSLAGFIALASLLNVFMNILLPLMRSLEGGLVPSRLRGRVFGLHQAFFNTGMTVGPLIGSWIYQAYHDTELLPGVTGVEATFLVAGLLGLAGAPFLAKLYQPREVQRAWGGAEA